MLTNKNNLKLPLAVFLAYSDYDGPVKDSKDFDPNEISVTGLMNPLRSIILSRQNRDSDKAIDLHDLVPSAMGSAMHSRSENAWRNPIAVVKACKALGFDDSIISKLVVVHGDCMPHTINDDMMFVPRGREPFTKHEIVIYIEKRSSKKVGKSAFAKTCFMLATCRSCLEAGCEDPTPFHESC